MGRKNLAPYRLVCSVEVHLCFVDIHVFVQVCGTIIELDVETLPFRGKLCVHNFVSEGMSFWLIVIFNDMSSFGMWPRCLLSLSLNNDCLFLVLGMFT